MVKKVWAVYYSGTKTTQKIVSLIGKTIAGILGVPLQTYDFSRPVMREGDLYFTEEDFVVFGSPTYAGRLPNVMLPYIETIQGEQTPALPVVLYGSRAYDDALMEWKTVLQKNGFRIVGAAAFIGAHAMSKTLAKGRPDAKDCQIAKQFAEQVAEKLQGKQIAPENCLVPGREPVGAYYTPLGTDEKPVRFLKAKPVTSDACHDCKKCVLLCPMGSISEENPRDITGICIKCGACVKLCPNHAKTFTDEALLSHVAYLESHYGKERKEPELFLN